MYRDIRDMWVIALREGTYKQGRGALCLSVQKPDNPTPQLQWCCLGVVEDLLRIHFLPELRWAESSSFGSSVGVFEDNAQPQTPYLWGGPLNNKYLDHRLIEEWLGVDPRYLYSSLRGGYDLTIPESVLRALADSADEKEQKLHERIREIATPTLARMNDRGCTFDEIATVLEHWPVIDRPDSANS